jgi:hypothetical protein
MGGVGVVLIPALNFLGLDFMVAKAVGRLLHIKYYKHQMKSAIVMVVLSHTYEFF